MSHEETTPQVTGAPDEIYLCYGELIHDDTHQNLRTHEDDVTWCEDRQEPSDVRYIRADLAQDWRVEAAKWLRARQDQPEWLAQAIEAAP
jgi:hypothetical protein